MLTDMFVTLPSEEQVNAMVAQIAKDVAGRYRYPCKQRWYHQENSNVRYDC